MPHEELICRACFKEWSIHSLLDARDAGDRLSCPNCSANIFAG